MYADDRSTPQLHQSRHVPIATGDRLSEHGEGRRCTADGCTTRLSRYNPSTTCSMHHGWADTRQRSYG